MNLRMVDLHTQYLNIKNDIDEAIEGVMATSSFIKGPCVSRFEGALAEYLGAAHVIGVANGTDALQIAFMALDIGPGDEVIAPSFTFVATAEAAALLGAVPVFADIDPLTFNISPDRIEELITEKTRAIIPVHLYGQPCEMSSIVRLANKHDLAIIEDNAQGIGSTYEGKFTGCIGDVGTLSFFPSKNLGCFGDGGAVVTNSPEIAHRVRLIANHGSEKKYHNEVIGINSRLDGLQAAVLSVKLKHLDSFNRARIEAADRYDNLFERSELVETPHRISNGRHVFHQYTIRVTRENPGARDALSKHLKEINIPHAVYYPVPVHRLPVYDTGKYSARYGDMAETDRAALEVLSLPMHTELTSAQQSYISDTINRFLES